MKYTGENWADLLDFCGKEAVKGFSKTPYGEAFIINLNTTPERRIEVKPENFVIRLGAKCFSVFDESDFYAEFMHEEPAPTTPEPSETMKSIIEAAKTYGAPYEAAPYTRAIDRFDSVEMGARSAARELELLHRAPPTTFSMPDDMVVDSLESDSLGNLTMKMHR